MFRTSVIIPTYNRPKEVTNCIRSILDQAFLPYELIIIDDGDLEEPPLEEECRRAGIKYIYFKKDKPGLTASRNKGINLATGDAVFFFDEDTILDRRYLEEAAIIYEDDEKKRIGGVGGVVTNMRPLKISDHLRRFFESLFLVTGYREGRVLLSGFCVNFRDTGFPIKRKMAVDFLPGCAQSYRREVFDRLCFDTEKYAAYGGEDKDFSHRVSKEYQLLVTPNAKIMHLESPKMRPDQVIKGRAFVSGRYTFFKDHVRRGWWSWVFFYYALFGFIIIKLATLPFPPARKKVDYLRGVFQALGNIITGRLKKVE